MSELKCVWCRGPIDGSDPRKTKYCKRQHGSYFYQRLWLNEQWEKYQNLETPGILGEVNGTSNPGSNIVES